MERVNIVLNDSEVTFPGENLKGVVNLTIDREGMTIDQHYVKFKLDRILERKSSSIVIRQGRTDFHLMEVVEIIFDDKSVKETLWNILNYFLCQK